ncbi:MAG TPA: TIM-barrel domain-containing protein [Flavobacterium sp.]|jgi:alpha-glucosidase (family GH31 glycosyl hydrolase)
MKKTGLLLAFLLVSTFASAQNSVRQYLNHSQNGNQIDIAVSDGSYRIVFYNSEIVETSFIPKGETYNAESHAVTLKPAALRLKSSKFGPATEYRTDGIAVRIQKSPFQLSYFYKGNELLSEKNGYSKTESAEILTFNIDSTEALYGGGARVLGMNRRGNRLQLYNRAHYGYEDRAELMNFCIPMMLSSKIYAVHFDNPAIGYLDLDSKKNNTLAYETISGRKTYQVIAGDEWTKLIDNYTRLTGRQPLPPRWALGNFASRFGYRDQEMAEKTAGLFVADKIPVDAMIFDLYWFGKTIKGTMGNLEFDRDNFPQPEQMISKLKDQGIKTILITEPFVLTTSGKWQEAVDKQVLVTDKAGNPFTYDFYFGNTGLIDIFKPEARTWFWDIYKDLANKGVAGVWGDLGEPEVFPSAAVTAKGSADEVHNIYGHNWAKLIFEGYQKDFPDQRPFILMRSGYSGSQRYGMLPWSGDVNRSWGGLSGQVEIALQMGMQGIGYMHSDLGGFAGEYNDNELYLRWLQYGVFQPIFRPHAQELVPSEPVYKDIVTKAAAKKIVEMRYRFMPYNYNIAYENSQTGIPLMRPLFFEEPDYESLYSFTTGYLWGHDLLVYPVTKPRIETMPIYFPGNSNWFDLHTDIEYGGGATVEVYTLPDRIPVFVRGGAFVPLAKVGQNTEQYSQSDLEIHYYLDKTVTRSTGSLYLDDGETANAAAKGQSQMLTFTSANTENSTVITVGNTQGKKYKNGAQQFDLLIHNIEKAPRAAYVNHQKVTVIPAGPGVYQIKVNTKSGATTKVKIDL